MVALHSLRPSLASFIRETHTDLTDEARLSPEVINQFRRDYVRRLIEEESGSVGSLEREVVENIHSNELLALEEHREASEPLPLGARVADRVASFGGSWTFIGIFGCVLLGWILINSWALRERAFDPYPYILMNLILSCIAALQAPVIMMSQNRSASRDRQSAESDYKINLKAELEIRHLHEKMDHLLKQQHSRLMEIQQIQTELLMELGDRRSRRPRDLVEPKTG